VGSHRETGIKNQMAEFENIISKNEISRLGRLVVLLNLAEQFDRAENASIENLIVCVNNQEVIINFDSKADSELELERTSSRRFVDRFEKNFSKRLIIQ
jgi:hypothetical protein